VEREAFGGAPDFVIEILSASTAGYDRERKREINAQAGVRKLWLIDPYGPTGTRFCQRRGDALAEVKPVDGIIRSTAVPGFWINLAWLWPAEGQGPISEVAVLRELGLT
jgi:Uma2 family endonuclease